VAVQGLVARSLFGMGWSLSKTLAKVMAVSSPAADAFSPDPVRRNGGWDEAVAKNLEAGFYNHSLCPVGPEGPAFCIWEDREGITAEEFQEFIDGPKGVNFGLGAWMNICREINVEMAGNPPYPRKF